ncbi:MAG: 4-hydroxythreonine-4-phosphate dehydrogenase PdxA [Planctomycetota bacterium]
MAKPPRVTIPDRVERPVLAVSMGDPGGIGPEILCQALGGPSNAKLFGTRFVVHGSGEAMHRAADAVGVEPFWWRVERGSDLLAAAMEQRVVLIDSDPWASGRGLMDPARRFEHGDTKQQGELSFRWVEDAIAQAKLPADDPRRAHAIVTGPISKAAWAMAGHQRWPGHTELLADRFNAKRVAMLFEGPSLRVVLATIHMPLMDVRDVLTIGRVYDAIDLGAQGCRMMGLADPRLAVCGLNPHAGEGGLLGDEEERLIAPAIDLARGHGMRVEGPFPGDTVFNRAVAGEFDLVVAMYHDQGLIPVKLLARDRSVNTTVGLPVARTSPDHGTAFDIAGRGVADAGSMRASLELAAACVRVTGEGIRH